MSNLYKNIFWAITTLIIISFVFSLLLESQVTPRQMSLNELVTKVNAGQVSQIKVNGEDLSIKLSDNTPATAKKETEAGITETLKNLGADAAALQKVQISVEGQSGWQFWESSLIPTVLPILLIGFFFWFMFR